MLSPESPSRSAIPSADGDAPKDNTNTERETKSSVVTNAAMGRETKPPLFQNNNPSSSGLFKSMNRSFIEGSTNDIPTINNSAPTKTGNGAAPRPCTNAFRSGYYDSSPSPPLHQDNKAIPLEGYKSKDNSPTNASSTKKLIQKKQEEEYNTQDPKLQTSKSEGNGNGSTKIGGDIKKHGTLIGNAKLLNSSSAVSSSGDDAKQFNLGNNLQQVIHDKEKDTALSNHSIKLDDRHRQMGEDSDSASPAAAMFMARMLRVNQVQLMQVAKPVPVSEDVGAFTSKDHPQDIPMSSKVVKPTPTNASAGVASKAGYYKQDIPMPSKVVKPTNASAGVASKAGCYKLGMGNEINAKHTNPSPSKRMNGESSTSLGVGIQKTVVCELKHAPPVAKTNTDNNVNNEMVPVEIPKAVAFKPVPVETPQDLDCAPYLVSTDGRILKIPKAAASKPVLDVEGNPIELNPNDVILSFTNDFYKATLFARFRELEAKKKKVEGKIEANAMIQFFKKRGGRLVKLVKRVRYEEVNDEVALTKLHRDFTAGRSETMSKWNVGSPSPKKRKGSLRCQDVPPQQESTTSGGGSGVADPRLPPTKPASPLIQSNASQPAVDNSKVEDEAMPDREEASDAKEASEVPGIDMSSTNESSVLVAMMSDHEASVKSPANECPVSPQFKAVKGSTPQRSSYAFVPTPGTPLEKKPAKHVKFNIGGTIVQVPSDVLLRYKDSKLASLTRSAIRVGDVPIPIPRQFDMFSHCVFYLCNNKVHLPSNIRKDAFMKEMQYFGIPYDEECISGGSRTSSNKQQISPADVTRPSHNTSTPAYQPDRHRQVSNVVTDLKGTATGGAKPSSPTPLDLEQGTRRSKRSRESTEDEIQFLEPNNHKKSQPCGKCEGCLREDCGKCRECKDKKKFGGPNKIRQKCSTRRCDKMIKPGDAEVRPHYKQASQSSGAKKATKSSSTKGTWSNAKPDDPIPSALDGENEAEKKKSQVASDKRWTENMMFLRPCIEDGGLINYAVIADEKIRNRMKTWVKEQRRQFRRLENKESTSLTKERIQLLEEAKFPKVHLNVSKKPGEPPMAVAKAMKELGLKKKPALAKLEPTASSLDLLCTIGSQSFSKELEWNQNPASRPSASLSKQDNKSKGSCGVCDACIREDCGTCRACLDKKKFGGNNTMRQKCYRRRCMYKKDRHPPPASVRTPGGNIGTRTGTATGTSTGMPTGTSTGTGTVISISINNHKSEEARMKSELAKITAELEAKARGHTYGLKLKSQSNLLTRSSRRTFEQMTRRPVQGYDDEDSSDHDSMDSSDDGDDSSMDSADSYDSSDDDSTVIMEDERFSTLPRGVSVRPSGKWQVQLFYAGDTRYIGLFDSKNEALTAYELAKECMESLDDDDNPSYNKVKKNLDLMRKAAFSQYSSSDQEDDESKDSNRATTREKRTHSVKSSTKSTRENVTGGGVFNQVSLVDAAATGCEKCIYELNTGKKTRDTHDDGCPRQRRPINKGTSSSSNKRESKNSSAKSFTTKSKATVAKPRPQVPKSSRLKNKLATKGRIFADNSDKRKIPINPEIISRANALAKKLPRGITVRPSGKWQVQLYYLGKSRYIGVFESKNHAAIGYELARSCVAGLGEESENETIIKKNVQLMRKAAYSFIDDGSIFIDDDDDDESSNRSNNKRQKTKTKPKAIVQKKSAAPSAPEVPETSQRSLRAMKRKQDEVDNIDGSDVEVVKPPAKIGATEKAKQERSSVFSRADLDLISSDAEKFVGIVQHVINTKKPFDELRKFSRNDVKDIVAAHDIKFGNQFWSPIRSLLYGAIDAAEKGEKVDHDFLLRMCSKPTASPKSKVKAKATPKQVVKASAAAPAAASTTASFTTGDAAAAYYLSISERSGTTHDLPEVGPGWKVNIIPRVGGDRSDSYYFSPKGHRFRSLKQAKAHKAKTAKGIVEVGDIGYTFRTIFSNKGGKAGWFDGEVIEILPDQKRKCRYGTDGYTEKLSLAELKEIVNHQDKTIFDKLAVAESNLLDLGAVGHKKEIVNHQDKAIFDKLAVAESKTLNFGAVGYKFKKKFVNGRIYDGVVVKILSNGGKNGKDRRCHYPSDDDYEDLSLKQLTRLAELEAQRPEISFTHNDLCECCGGAGELLCCSTCNLVYHLGCYPNMNEEPPDDWSCAYCVCDNTKKFSKEDREDANATVKAIETLKDRARRKKSKKRQR